MTRLFVLMTLSLCLNFSVWAQKDKKEKATEFETAGLDSATVALLKKVTSLKFLNEGEVSIADGKAKINIPKGFKYLDGQQSHVILEELWGNPPQTTDGMLFLANANMLEDDNWAFVVNYENEGHVDDSDAKDMNYTELLTQMKEDTKEGSKERVKLGYPSLELVGWASPPYYDANQKTLHWAKEINFEGTTEHTLNYDVRVLGRQGLVSLNAVGSMSNLDTVKSRIPAILSAVAFTDGNKYSDFNSSIDKVAAVGIGGLVAGKVLAKVGIFAFLLKYIKLIFIAVAGGGAWIWKKITGKGNEDEVV